MRDGTPTLHQNERQLQLTSITNVSIPSTLDCTDEYTAFDNRH